MSTPIKTIYSSFKAHASGRILCICYANGSFRLFETVIDHVTFEEMCNWFYYCREGLALKDEEMEDALDLYRGER